MKHMKHIKTFKSFVNESKINEQTIGSRAKKLADLAGNDTFLTDMMDADEWDDYKKEVMKAVKKIGGNQNDIAVIGSEGADNWDACVNYAKSSGIKHAIASTDDGDFLVYLCNESINESYGKSLDALKAALPGVKFTPMSPDDLGDPEGYKSVEGYSFIVSGVDEPATVVIYNGNSFCFWYDSAPIGTSLHSKSEINNMNNMGSEIPKPLAKLNKDVFKSVVDYLKEY